MLGSHSLAERLRARLDQLGLNVSQLAELAGVNRSFLYDVLRGRSTRPSLDTLALVARALKVERDWLTHGVGEVEGVSPFIDNPDESFVAIAEAIPRPSMGGGAVVHEDGVRPGRAYHFRRSWIRDSLRASPTELRIMQVEGDSMEPSLRDGDTVLVDMSRRSPLPAGIFVLHDGMGLVAKRLEHVPLSEPPKLRIISDNPLYAPYEALAEDVKIIGRIRWFAREV